MDALRLSKRLWAVQARALTIVCTAAVLVSSAAFAQSAEIVGRSSAASSIEVRDVKASLESVSGVLVNRSGGTVSQVVLMFQHTWLWNNERKPGKDNPGRTEHFRVLEDIPANGEVRFDYKPEPPLPNRTDGRFETRVEVVEFTEGPSK